MILNLDKCFCRKSAVVGYIKTTRNTLNQTFFDNAKRSKDYDREDIVLYNPKKGMEFTQKIISKAKQTGIQAKYIPLVNMTPDQIVELMLRAKVYIDFGNFPGPERIPREAVLLGCNIITSRNGSANNDIDVPIPDTLKYKDIEKNIPMILECIQDMLLHYDKYYMYYENYRIKVLEQKILLTENSKALLKKLS